MSVLTDLIMENGYTVSQQTVFILSVVTSFDKLNMTLELY